MYKPETFALVDPPEVVRLEPCLVGEPLSAKLTAVPGGARVVLRNTTARRRLFVIEGECLRLTVCWIHPNDNASGRFLGGRVAGGE